MLGGQRATVPQHRGQELACFHSPLSARGSTLGLVPGPKGGAAESRLPGGRVGCARGPDASPGSCAGQRCQRGPCRPPRDGSEAKGVRLTDVRPGVLRAPSVLSAALKPRPQRQGLGPPTRIHNVCQQHRQNNVSPGHHISNKGHVCMCACGCMCMHVCTHVCSYMCEHVCVCACMHVCMRVYMHMCIGCVCVYAYVCMYVCVCVCTCVSTCVPACTYACICTGCVYMNVCDVCACVCMCMYIGCVCVSVCVLFYFMANQIKAPSDRLLDRAMRAHSTPSALTEPALTAPL